MKYSYWHNKQYVIFAITSVWEVLGMYILRHNKAICGYVVVGGVENLMESLIGRRGKDGTEKSCKSFD